MSSSTLRSAGRFAPGARAGRANGPVVRSAVALAGSSTSSIRALGEQRHRATNAVLANASEPGTIEARFWSKVDTTGGAFACWLWLGSRSGGRHGLVSSKRKYGDFKVGGRNVRAHRYAYGLLVGPIPDGLTLDHLCRNTACVNPIHLEPVSGLENIRRSWLLRAAPS